MISSVFRGSPADAAGVRVGDHIVAIDGNTVAQISPDLSSLTAGQSVELALLRGRRPRTVLLSVAGMSQLLRSLANANHNSDVQVADLRRP
jgi:predicted metalloprotease with PDZ domain